ncbi:ecdysone 20-monooxygenase [Galendromus occidentalis]|uniref:Ecdysone 20-monooxygenase n=1 Tax=Galendromus occidentalis TaxID=34638 RepID=A0AAJ6QZ81_9ACAR|nr:ecdysone 20-monooxygenase [Galendromus occidentalis]
MNAQEIDKQRDGRTHGLTIKISSLSLFSEIPGPWPSFPLVGTNWQYWGQKQDLFQLHKAFEHKLLKYGPICKEEYQYRRPVVHLFHAESFPALFRSQGSCPIRPPNEFVCKYRREHPEKYSGVGLSNALGEEWRSMRLALAPVLRQMSAIHTKDMLDIQTEICDDWVRHLQESAQDGVVADIQELLYMLALESIFALCLEKRLGCFEGNPRAREMVQATKDLFECYQKLYYGSPLWKKVPTKPYLDFCKAEETVYRITEDFLREASATESQSRVLRALTTLPNFDWKDVQLTAMDFIVGGVFTITQSMAFLIHQIAINKRVQDKLVRTLRNAPIPATDPYLKACMKETFRISPTVPGVMRVLPEDTVLCDYHVPAGTAVFANSLIACRNEETFHRASEFIPERWLDGRPQFPFALLPFGFGARMCPGRHFAELEMCSAVASLLKKFEISSPMEQIPVKCIFVIAPEGEVPIEIQPRGNDGPD